MPTDASRDHYQALLIPDSRVEYWEDESTVSPKGHHVGQPASNGGSQLALRALRRDRSDSVAGTSIDVSTQTGGLPALRAGPRAASYVWQYDNDGAEEWRGWDPPNAVNQYKSLKQSGTPSGYSYRFPSAIYDRSSGRAYAVWQVETTVDRRIEVATHPVGADAWAVQTAFASGQPASSSPGHPCLVALPNGDVHCYYWHHDTDLGTATIRAYRSTGNNTGATWTLLSNAVIEDDLDTGDYSVHQLRAAEHNGQIVLIAQVRRSVATASNERDTFIQWASSDGGFSFELVEEWPDVAEVGGRWFSLWADDDGFHIVWFERVTTGTTGRRPRHTLFGSAYTSFRKGETTTFGTNSASSTTTASGFDTIDDAVSGACMGEDGTYHWYGIQSNGFAATYASYDRGRNWTALNTNSSQWIATGTDPGPRYIAPVAHEGRVMMLHSINSSTSSIDETVGCFWLGGYTTVNMPEYGSGGWDSRRSSWFKSYLPYDQPSDMGFTLTGTFSVEDLRVGGWIDFEVSSPATPYYQRAISSTDPSVGAFGLVEFATSDSRSGGVANDQQTCMFEIVLSDGSSESYGFRVTADDSNVYAFEMTGAATYSQIATATPDVTTGLQVFWVLHEDDVRIWYRESGSLQDGDRTWTELIHETGLTDLYSGVSAGYARFGASLDVGDVASFRQFHYSTETTLTSSQKAPENLIGQTNPTDLHGRAYSVSGTYVADSLVIAATGGPAVASDNWVFPSAYDYPVSNVLDPSPRAIFKQGSASGSQSIAFRWDDNGNASMGRDVIGIALVGTTLGEFRLQLYDADTASWTGNYQIDTAFDGLDFVRDGNTVTTGVTASSELLVRMGEFDGGYFVDAENNGRNGLYIDRTYAGRWENGSLAPVLTLSGDATSHATSGTDGQIIPRTVVIVLSLEGADYQGVRIQFPSAGNYPVAPDGVWEIGTMVVGPVILHPDEQAWGRVIETQANTEVSRQRDGSTRSRVHGPVRRIVDVSWIDGVDTRGASKNTDDPDTHYIEPGSGDVVAFSGSTPWDLQGLTYMLDGADQPVVYLPRVETLPENGDPLRVLLSQPTFSSLFDPTFSSPP